MAKKDIMNTGGLSWNELQSLNRKMQGLEPLSDAEKSIMNLPSGAAMREQLYMTPSVEPTRKDSGQVTPFGESYWDPEGMVNDYTLQHLENERANNQSALAQIGNGLIKMGTTALTTFADGTVGTLVGLGQGIQNLADEDENTGFWQGVWNNDFNRAMSDVQEAMERIAPNYYTDEQRESSWNSAANLLSANFLGDKLIKNAGFTIGTMAVLAVPGFDMNWLAKGVQTVAKGMNASKGTIQNLGALSKYVSSGLMSAHGEASIEAINAVKDGQKSAYADIDTRIKEATAASEQQILTDMMNGMSESDARLAHVQRVGEINEEGKQAKAQADAYLRDIGNSVYGANIALLSISNGLQFGDILKGGYNFRKALTDYGIKLTAEGKEVGAREFGRALFDTGRNAEIKAAKTGINYGKVLGDTAMRFSEEGFEEGSQNLISDSNQIQAAAKLQKWATDRFNSGHDKYSLWEKQINPQVTEDLVDYTKALFKTWDTNFGTFSSPGWEEVLLGGLTGALGTAGIRRNKQGTLGIGWQGGFVEAINEQKNEMSETDMAISRFNNMLNSPKFRNSMMQAAGTLAATYDMEKALADSNVLAYKNAEMMEVVNNAIMFRDNGLIDVFKGYYESAAQDVSDDTVKELRSQLADVKSGKSYLDTMSDEDIKAMIKDKASSTLEKIDNTLSIYEEMERKYTDAFRAVDVEPYLAKIKNDGIREEVRLGVVDMATQGVREMTYYKSLYDDMQRRKDELTQELEKIDDRDIDAASHRAQLNKDIKQLDKSIAEVKELYDDYNAHPEKMIEHRVKASELAVKRQIGKDNEQTINRYLGATNLQEVADTFMFGNYNSAVLDEAIKTARDNKLDDQVKLLEKFYPFTVESNAVESAIDKVTETMPEGLRESNKRYLGRVVQSVMDNVLQDTTDSTGSISTAIREEVDRIIDELPTSEDVLKHATLLASLTAIADELDKAHVAAATPTTKLDSVEKPKETTPTTASEEAKEEAKPTMGDSPKPTGTITPESKGLMDFDNFETVEPEETAGTEPAIESTPETSEPSITDNLLKATERATSQKELDDILRTATESHDEKLISDEDLTRITGAVNNKKLLTTDPVPNPLSPTGGNEQNTQVTPNREESMGEEPEPEKNALSEEEQLNILVEWAEGKLSKEEAIDKLKGTKYVNETKGNKALGTVDGIHFTRAVERDLGKYITDKYPFLKVGNVKVATGVSTFGGDMGLLIVTDRDGVEYGIPSNFIRSLAEGGRATEAIKKGDKPELTVAEVGIVRRTETPDEKDKRAKDRSFAGVSYQKYANSINWRGEDRGVAKPKSDDADYIKLRKLLTQYGIDYEHVVNNYLYEMLDEKGRLEVQYMVMRDTNDDVVTGKEKDHIHIFLVADPSKVKKYADKDEKLRSTIIDVNGQKKVVVGILDSGSNTKLIKQLNGIRDRYNQMPDDQKANRYTIIPELHNYIYDMNGGAMIREIEGGQKGDVDLKSLLDSDSREVNPRGLKIGDIRFAIAIGKEGETELRFFQAHRNDNFFDPVSLPVSPGNVWMFVRDATGTFIPTPIAATHYNSEWYNKDSRLGKKIEETINRLATSEDMAATKQAIAELSSLLVFNGGDIKGNRIFFDEKTGEISHRVMNIKGGSLLEDSIIVDANSPFETTGNPITTFTVGQPMSDEQKSANISMLQAMIQDINPMINISTRTLGNKGGANEYLEAGVLRVGLRSLGMTNAQTYLYQVDEQLKPNMTAYTGEVTTSLGEYGNTVYIGAESENNRYRLRGDRWYDKDGNLVTDPSKLEILDVAYKIKNGTITPTLVDGVQYWESGDGVFSQRAHGNYSKLGPKETEAYRKAKSAEAERKKKEEETKQEAAKTPTEPQKYNVGETIKGYNIVSVVIDNGIIKYEYDHPTLGHGFISQLELDNIEVKPTEPTEPVVKKPQESDKTFYEKKVESDNIITFADMMLDDEFYESLVNAFDEAVSENPHLKEIGLPDLDGDVDVIEEWLAKYVGAEFIPKTVSDMQQLIDRLKNCKL